MTTTIINGSDISRLQQRIRVVDLTGRSEYVFDSSQGFNPAGFVRYLFYLQDAKVSNDGASLHLRVSGHSGASGYDYVAGYMNENASGGRTHVSTGDTEVQLFATIGNVAADELGLNGNSEIVNLGGSAAYPVIRYDYHMNDASNLCYWNNGFGRRLSLAQITSFDHVLSAGTFTAGSLDIIGIRRP